MSTSRLFAMLSLMLLAAVMSFFVSIQPAAAQESSPSQLRCGTHSSSMAPTAPISPMTSAATSVYSGVMPAAWTMTRQRAISLATIFA